MRVGKRKGGGNQGKKREKIEIKCGTKKVPRVHMNLPCLCIFEHICMHVKKIKL